MPKAALYQTLGSIILLAVLVIQPAHAGGEVGDHVNHLSDNLENYAEEVVWLIDKIDDIVERYEKDGASAAHPEEVVDHWEAVNFHAAIESNFVPAYASIWQGLYGLKGSIEKDSSLDIVRQEQENLEQALWQSLGAVRLAAQFQDRGLLENVALRQGAPSNSFEVLEEIAMHLDRVVAKYAEQLNEEAVTIVHDTYLNLFEGVEGELITQDADLVEALEKDFNVTLPLAIQNNTGVDSVRGVVVDMQDKIGMAISLLQQANKTKKSVF
ncbi:MAG: hypothetical protein ACI945_000671 [Pseudohongiellaceae bacterium]|jgi:hypothetical protein